MTRTVQLTSDHFTLQTLTSPNYNNKTVLVFYSASWCGFCQSFLPIFKKLSESMPHIIFAKIDVDAQRSFITNNNNLVHPLYIVKSYPTIVIYKNGNFVHFVENRDENILIKKLDYIDKLK